MTILVPTLGLLALSFSGGLHVPYPQRWLDAGPESGKLVVIVYLTKDCHVFHSVLEVPNVELSSSEIDALVESIAYDDEPNYSPAAKKVALLAAFGSDEWPSKDHVWTTTESKQYLGVLDNLGPWPVTRVLQGWIDGVILKCEFSSAGTLQQAQIFNPESKNWDSIPNFMFLEGLAARTFTFRVE